MYSLQSFFHTPWSRIWLMIYLVENRVALKCNHVKNVVKGSFLFFNGISKMYICALIVHRLSICSFIFDIHCLQNVFPLPHRSLTFFDGFTFTADLRFFFFTPKNPLKFSNALFCRWKEISKNVADILYFLNILCFFEKCHWKLQKISAEFLKLRFSNK